MNELLHMVTTALHGAWRRRWIGLAVAWTVGALGVVGLLRMSDRYEATARVYVDTKTVLKPLMRDLAVEPDVDLTVAMLARTMITRPNIEQLIGPAYLALGPMAAAERERTVDALMRDIKLTGSGRDNIFSFSFRDTDPVRARRVVEKAIAFFVESDQASKTRDAESARMFIDQQIKTYEVRLAEAESRLKDFKLRNLGIADSSGKDYFTRMSALTEELGRTSVELRAAEQSRDALRHELAGETVSLLPDPATVVEVPTTPELDARLDAQRRQLDELLRRYTELHPDVVATRRSIARLDEQKQQEIETRRRALLARPAPPVPTSNPVSQQIKLRLAEAEATAAALRVRASDLQGRANQLRASATRVPLIEAELAQLNRDYEVVRRNYEAMVGRREKASLSEDIDATRIANNIRVTDPPRSSPRPVFPSRLSLAPLLLIFSLVVGAAASYVASQLWPTFNSAASLRSVTQRLVLGSVSALVTDEVLRRGRHNAFAFGSATMGLVALFGVWIAWMSRAVGV